MKKFNKFIKEDLHSKHPDRIGRSPYIFGDNGLEKTDSTSDYQYWLKDDEYEKLKPFSENLVELLSSLDEEKKLRIQQFKAAVYKVIDDGKKKL